MTSSRGLHICFLTAFFVLLSFATFAARQGVDGYELSIYAAVGSLYWLSILTATFGSIMLYWLSDTGFIRIVALLCAAMSGLSILLLPIFRGYHFYGPADPMTHLGWSNDLANGAIGPLDLLYPALHLYTVFVSGVTGLPLSRSLLLITTIFPVIWVLGMGLIARLFLIEREAFAAGVFAALLFLPIQPISGYFRPHPSTLGLFLLPLGIWLFVRTFLPGTTDEPEFTIAFVTISLGIVLLHPQQALNLLVITVVMLFATWWIRSEISLTAASKSSIPAFISLSIAVGIIITVNDQLRYLLISIVRQFFSRLSLSSDSGGGEIASRGMVLDELGMSLHHLGLRIGSKYLLALVFVAVTAHYYRDTRDDLLFAVCAGSIVPGAFLGVFIVIGRYNLATRYISALAVIATIIVAIGIGHGAVLANKLHGRRRTLGRIGIAAGIILIFGISLVSLHLGPFVLQPNDQVTESHFAGFELSFEYDDGETPYIHTRSRVFRFRQATGGVESSEPVPVYRHNGTGPRVPDGFAGQSIHNRYPEPVYLALRDTDRATDVTLYNGARYSSDDFEYVERTPGIDRIITTGGVDIYSIRSDSSGERNG